MMWFNWRPSRILNRTTAYPFGRDVDTLIVCRNQAAREVAIHALRLKARYELYYGVLMGERFDTIIVLPPFCLNTSEKEQQIFSALVNDYLPTKLTPGGKLHVL